MRSSPLTPARCLQHAGPALTPPLGALPPPHSTRRFPRVSVSLGQTRGEHPPSATPRPTCSPAKGLGSAERGRAGRRQRAGRARTQPAQQQPRRCRPRGQPGHRAPAGPRSLQADGQVGSPTVPAGARSLYIRFRKNKGERERSKSVLCVKLDYARVAWILYNRRHDQT